MPETDPLTLHFRRIDERNNRLRDKNERLEIELAEMRQKQTTPINAPTKPRQG